MIFVSVGTQKFSFVRLLNKVDDLVKSGYIKEDVFAQIGHSAYVPESYIYEKFISEEMFDQKLRECRILITHGGVGTITRGLKENKTVIIVPRMKKYHEHVDDHQIEIAKAFKNRYFALCCQNVEELGVCIAEAEKSKLEKYFFSNAGVSQCIRTFILDSEGRKSYGPRI